jgi:hypothetical protein
MEEVKKMILKPNLEMVAAQYEDNNKKLICTFLDEEFGEIRDVNFNLQSFDKDSKKFVDNPEKAAQVEEWCKEHFGLSFLEMGQAVGMRKDIYCYDNFNSVFEVKMVEKFEEDMLGQLLTVDVVEAFDDGRKIAIRFEYDGKLYESKMQYADYLEARQEWFPNPQKRKKQFEKFEEKFQMPVEEIENMVGREVVVEVKKAMGKYIYCEVKPFPKKPAAKKERKTS